MTLSVGKEVVTMREIKFRAWEDPNVPAPGYADNPKFMGAMYYEVQNKSFFSEWLKDPGYILMQYTGLKDKNGKEIYEGDIVKFEEGDLAEVVYMDDGFKLVGEHFTGDALYPQTRDGIWGEVIGNIYENKELLS